MKSILSTEELSQLYSFRKEVHQHPELSGKEKETARRVNGFLKDTNADKVIADLGGNGIAFIYHGKEEGPTILLRCELDALPIQESNDFDHKSGRSGVSHKCGHDGHLTMLAGVGKTLKEKRPMKGKVVLLFQPAEETGEGAEWVMQDPRFGEVRPDKAFALHNLPGFPKGQVVLKNEVFACASKGMEVFFDGATSHAGEPHNGRSPGLAMADLVKELTPLHKKEGYKDFTLVTVIHALLGEIAFGTSPGHAEVRATLRSTLDEDMEKLTLRAEQMVEEIAIRDGVKHSIGYREVFPSTVNDEASVQALESIVKEKELDHRFIDTPFRWSEDFGHFTAINGGALFGLGSGEQQPDLHNDDYDFPDEIMEVGIDVFHGLLERYNGLE